MKPHESVYWWEGLPEPEGFDDAPPAKTDLLIIGAGYTGLSAAIAAHDAGASVCVVDAGVPGKGASTRNGGMFGAHPRLGKAQLAALFGAETAEGIFREANDAYEFVRGLHEAEGIDCDYQQTGRIILAWTRKDMERLKKTAEDANASGVEAKVVDKADLGDEIGTPRYHGGILLPKHGAIQPRKAHDGMIAALRSRGVPIVSNCKVESLERASGRWTAQTAKGVIAAEKTILATNGYTGPEFPWADRRVFALPSFIIATEQVSPNLLGQLAPGRRMMVETRARHSYFRVSPDGTRIIYGGRAAMAPLDLQTAAKRLRQTMIEVWPQARDLKIEKVWTGNTGYAFDHMPSVGEHEGLHYAIAFSGSGTVMAPYLGAKAAWRALGDPRGETAYSRTSLRTHWLYPGGTPHFLKAADLWYRWAVDTAQNVRARL